MKKLLICTNFRASPHQASCAARGSLLLASALQQTIKNENLTIEIEQVNCLGFCDVGINLHLSPNGEFIHQANCSEQSQASILFSVKKFILQD